MFRAGLYADALIAFPSSVFPWLLTRSTNSWSSSTDYWLPARSVFQLL